MATSAKYILSYVLLFLLHAALTAQNSSPVQLDTTNYRIVTDENGEQYIEQTLSWQRIDYIREYEVIIDRQDENGHWVTVEQTTTQDNSITLRLDGGQYRCAVIIYNLLGKKAYQTPYTEFTVEKATRPEIRSLSPSLIYLDEPVSGTFSVRGVQLLPESDFVLLRLSNNETLTPESYVPDGRGRSAEVTFDTSLFDTGEYVLQVKNPGGFQAEMPLTIKFYKWYDFTISAGYSPNFVLADDTIIHYFDTRMALLGGDFRMTFIPLKRRFGYIGVSLSMLYHRLSTQLDAYNLSVNVFQAYINAVYQYPIIKNRLVIDAHAGVGFLFLHNLIFAYPHDITSDPFTSFYFAANAGAALQLYVWKRLYIEAKADFMIAPIMKDMYLMSVQPVLSIGYQF